MDVFEAAISWLWEDPAFVAFLQIVANVHKASALESRSKLARLGVSRN